MDRSGYRYEEDYGRPRGKTNYFLWTVAILLLIGMAFAAWLGSYYIFGQPERAESYRILQKLHKIEAPKRFQLTSAPAGEFLSARQLYERYSAMGPAELAKADVQLTRNYIRNYQGVGGLVPYVVGRFTIMDARELNAGDVFTSGMVALTTAADYGELLLEHVYPSDAQAVSLMKETLATGLEVKLDRGHDLSAVVHVERLRDGRLMLTAVPLLYGSYTVTQGRGMFSLEPPFLLNLAPGWPIYKDSPRRKAEIRFATYRRNAAPVPGGVPMPGLGGTPAPASATNELVRVETAEPLETPTPTPAVAAKATPKGGKLAKNAKAEPSPSSTPAHRLAQGSPPPASPVPSEVPALPALPVTSREGALASTAGGGTWKTFPPGRMPAGRLIGTSDLGDVAQRGLAGERVYLRGQFVVNFAEGNRAVLRPRSNLRESVMNFGAPSSTRIVVDFPSGTKPPAAGSTVTRDADRPYEITEVRKQSDGQLNVFVREIMQ
ncbi:MAG: hypothetical protein ACR2NX_15430 [Chthoniobacterales bacterium]